MNKKDLYKLKPGTWLEVLWKDAPPMAALLISKVEPDKGDVSLHLFYPNTGRSDSHAVHTQVTRVLGTLECPTVISDSTARI